MLAFFSPKVKHAFNPSKGEEVVAGEQEIPVSETS